MWTTILSSLLPFAIKLIQSYFERQNRRSDAKRRWIAFVESMADSMGGSANLRKSWRDQAARLKEKQSFTYQKISPYRNREALLKAAKELGVKEITGNGSNPLIEEYHKFSTEENDISMKDNIPWCASFVCWVLEKVGMESTNSKMARSFEHWGKSSLSNPLPGDIVTFYRNRRSSGEGHVAFLIKYDKKFVTVLGGNQNDEVNITRYSTERMTDIRRSSKAGNYSPEQREELLTISKDILNGAHVQDPGKVI